MTPEQKIKHAILLRHQEQMKDWETPIELPGLTADNVEQVFADMNEEYELQDVTNEFREGDVETPDITAPSSRHLEAKSVAARMPDGSWVGWIYWYGGGKHSEPEAEPWMNKAYDLVVTGEKVVTTLTFEKVA